nr:ras-related protein RABA4d-like [Ipomoea batatas]
MLVFDLTKRQSFDHMARWLEELRGHADKNIVIMLIGNKCDLAHLRAVPTEDAQEFAERENLFFMETSALGDTNVESAFMTVLTQIYTIISKKSLVATEDAKAGSLKGTRINVVPGEEPNAGASSLSLYQPGRAASLNHFLFPVHFTFINQGFDTMPEARDRLSRPVDIAEVYRRRVTGIDIDAGGIVHLVRDDADDLGVGSPFRWGATGLTGAVGAGSAAAAAAAATAGGVGTPIRRSPFRARRGRGSSARVIGRENISHTGRRPVRARGSALPSWYPRRPLQDITYITRAYQRRRERLREGEEGVEPGTPLLRDQTSLDPTVATPSAQLEHNPPITPFPTLRSRLCPPSVDKLKDQNVQDWEFLTPEKKLLNSIDTVERVFKEELQKLQRTPSAKKAEREKRVKTLMSMR